MNKKQVITEIRDIVGGYSCHDWLIVSNMDNGKWSTYSGLGRFCWDNADRETDMLVCHTANDCTLKEASEILQHELDLKIEWEQIEKTIRGDILADALSGNQY